MRLNQPIGKHYPTKVNMNLAMKESHKREWGKVGAAAAVLAVFIAAFTKFAVIDRLLAANEAEYTAARTVAQLNALQAANLPYPEVLEEYNEYNMSRSVSELRTDTQDILKLMEQEVMSMAKVESFSASGGVIVTKISGVTLNQISQIFRSLSGNPLVAHVQVFTASSNEEDQDALTTASFTITLAVEAGLSPEGDQALTGEEEVHVVGKKRSDGEDAVGSEGGAGL